jgi:Flp pilus assembly protein TadB
MEYFFWIVFLLGIGMCAFLLQRNFHRNRTRKLIDVHEDIYGKSIANLFDYRTVIIENSPALSFLQKIETSIILKLKISLSLGSILFLCNFLGFIHIEIKTLAMCMLLNFAVVIVLPAMMIKPMIATRIKAMLDALPYFTDLIAVCIQSGMTVESAIKFIAQHADELDKNLARLMNYLIKRAEMTGLEEGLLDFYRSMDLTEMRMFCSTLQQSVHYGTSLYENLMELSRDIRELQLLDSEEKIGKLSARMSIPLILFIMFPITVLIAAPGILRILKNALF